jgi:hypothetical protein
MIKARNSGKSTIMQNPSTNLSQSLISARRALLTPPTAAPRGLWRTDVATRKAFASYQEDWRKELWRARHFG